MAFDPTPWFIGGGAQHSVDVARLLAFASTGGAEGIVSPGDLKVRALDTPGSSVIIGPGAALILNRSAGADGQTYVMRAPTDTTVEVAPTGPSGRSDLLVVRVEDPQYAPWQPPADPVTAQYVVPFVVQGVPGDTVDAAALNLGYSAVAVARLDIPANTGTITPGMVKDVRRLARPRNQRVQLTGNPASATLTSGSYIGFPDYRPTVQVPPWATHALVMGHITSLGVVGGDTLGAFRLQFGVPGGATELGSDQPFNYDGSGGDQRTSELVVAQVDVRAMRGRNAEVVIGARKQSGAGSLKALSGTRVTFDVQFTELVL